MRLTKITIDSFKTVATPQELLLDPRATILVGANESGKTNVLQAIELLSPLNDLAKEDISKINRDRYSRKELPYITFTFSLLKQETAKIAEIIPELSDENSVTIARKGNGVQSFSIIVSSEKFVPKLSATKSKLLDEKRKLEIKLEAANNEYKVLTAHVTSSERKQGIKSVAPDRSTFDDKFQKRVAVLRYELDKTNDLLSDLLAKVHDLDSKISEAARNIIMTDSDSMNKLLQLLPQATYFVTSELIPESLPISEIKEQKTSQAKIVGNLLKLGKIVNFSELDEPYRTLKHTLRGVSETITKEFNEFYSQEKIEIELEKQGNDLAVSINGGVSISSSPKERSVGLQWLLSFFATFAYLKQDFWKSTIFLVDEPAVLLHPRGQKDVLSIIEKMTQNNQIIYSTHSPFLINRNYPQRIRLLTKDPEKGTLINNKPYSDGKTKFWEPLRSSIGICLGDVLSLGEKNLIVEGISEQIIITRISKKFADIGCPFIDLEKVSIVPAMGATCEEALARFSLSEGLAAISLLDNDSEGKRVLRHLERDEQIRLISINKVKKDAVTIEDLFPDNSYITAFNSVYSKFDDFKEYIKENKDEGKSGIVEKIEKHLKSIGYSKLDKVGVANKLIENLELNDKNISQYAPFRELFTVLNNRFENS